MPLSLAQTQAVSALARHLYPYLPGSSAWRGTYTFASAAAEHRVGQFWTGGSKLPALTSLLELTLANRGSSVLPSDRDNRARRAQIPGEVRYAYE